MGIGCWIGLHDWFYYDEFNAFDNDRRMCRSCGKIESTYMNTAMGYGYDPCGYASKEEKEEILNPENQLKKYQEELDQLLERKRERRELDKLFSDITPSQSMIETRSMLTGAEGSLIRKYNSKIRELTLITSEKRTEPEQ